jgi:hypothetical protein
MPHTFLNGSNDKQTLHIECRLSFGLSNRYSIGYSIFLSEPTYSSLQYSSIPITV